MNGRILPKALLGSLLVALAIWLALDAVATRFLEDELAAALQARLAAEAKLLAAVAPRQPAELANWVNTTAAPLQAQVSVLNADGSILAQAGEQGDNPAGAVTASAPLGEGRVLRVTGPQPPMNFAPFRQRLLAILIGGGLLIGLLTGVSIWLYSRRVARTRRYLEGLLEPEIADRELPSGDDELGKLAQSLRRASRHIRHLVERLQVEGARRDAMLASMVEGVLAVDQDLRVTFYNDAFARAAGSRSAAAGTRLVDLVRDPALLEIMTSVLASGQPAERKLKLAGSEERCFQVLAGPLSGPPPRGGLAILHDITKLERLERVRKDFVANVSHELRTPLAAIRGYAETLLSGALEEPEHSHRFVEVILAHSIQLNNIASDLLTLSELESEGEAIAPPSKVPVRPALESAIRTVESGARVRGVRLIRGRIDDASVIGHELRLGQALINLLDNAVKFNKPDGEVRVGSQANDGEVSITIEDTGIGIPSDDLPRIFERFYRVDKAHSRAVGGTGLGLSIVKHVVEQMGGTIRVESSMGKGSRFTIVLRTP